MKRLTTLLMVFFMTSLMVFSQNEAKPFKTHVYNKEYDVFLELNLYEEAIKIPGQDILGDVFGYLKKTIDSRVWVIMDVEFSKEGKKATVSMINDYGSEDLTAEITLNSDGTYTLKQLSGSTIKVAGKNKWIKLPKTLVFSKK